MAPRWSIILNEHGCQLQVYWRSPNNIEKGYFLSIARVFLCSAIRKRGGGGNTHEID